MKIHSFLILSLAAALASCTPYTGPNLGSRGSWYSNDTGPSPELKKYRKIPLGHPDPQGRANMVVSPYRPYNIIDVTGYSSGDIVGDPSTALVNPATGSRDPRTVRHFRIP